MQCDGCLVINPTPVVAPTMSVVPGDFAGTLNGVEGAGVLLDGMAVRWLRRFRRDGARFCICFDYLLDAPCGDCSVGSAEEVEGVNGVERVGKLRGNSSGFALSGRGWVLMGPRR